MTTPNEELIARLRVLECGPCVFWEAAEALQSQAERIKALETVPMKYRRMQFNAELQEENARLRAQIAEIEKTEPVFYEFQWTNPGNQPNQPEKMFAWVPVEPHWNGTVQQKVDELLAYRYEDKPTYRVRALFTRPMPADVTELVEALEKLARLGNGEHYGNSDGNMIARDALAKYKGEK